MKNNVVKALALLLSVNCCFPGMIVKAEEPDEKEKNVVDLLSGVGAEGFSNPSQILQNPFEFVEVPQFDSNDIPSLLGYQDDRKNENEKDIVAKHLTEASDEEKNDEEINKESIASEDVGLNHLQIPQKLGVVIDPWEMDGKEQIYSEEYVIRNDGEMPGVLTLSNLACRPQEQSGVIVTANPAGLHDGDEKLICMKMIFGNGDQIDLSEDASTYQVELQPGEELSICFEGEVNEYASEGWKDGDVTVTVAYSWDVKQTSDDVEEKEKVSEDIKMENGTEEAEEGKEDGKISQDIDSDANDGEINGNKEEQIDEEVQESEEGAENEEATEDEEIIQSKEEDEKIEEKDEPEVIKLKEFKAVEFVIYKWEKDDEGCLCSGGYLVKNEGETEGEFVLSDLLYTDEEQNEIDILGKKEGVNESESEPFHVELVLEDGERIDITQKVSKKDMEDTQEVLENNLEEKGYRVILKPGEELKFRLVGEWDDADSEEIYKGNIMVKVIGSWDREEVRNAE